MTNEHWKDAPDEHDYPAARQYLSLLVHPKTAKALAKSLADAPLTYAKAKTCCAPASSICVLPTTQTCARIS